MQLPEPAVGDGGGVSFTTVTTFVADASLTLPAAGVPVIRITVSWLIDHGSHVVRYCRNQARGDALAAR